MTKLVVGAFAGLLLVVTMAAPALALRDPFDPVISQTELTGDGTGTTGDGPGTTGDGTGTTGDGTGTTGDGTGTTGGTGTNLAGENGADGLANTGVDAEPWLVAAYVLIAVGAGAVVVSKVNGNPV